MKTNLLRIDTPCANGAGHRDLRKILLCPGPVMLSDAVQRAVLTTNIGHREVEFSDILRQSAKLLRPVVGADDSYEIAFVTGSGTAANECIIAGLAGQGAILVISNGEFGERLAEVARTHSADVDHLRFEWQEAIDLVRLQATLQAKAYRLVLVVHHETSTGMLNPVAQVAALARAHGALISVDAVSSIGGEHIEMIEWGIDILVGASGKALSAMTGVGILVVRTQVLATLETADKASHYLDLKKHFHFMREFAQTPNTPAIHAFVALHASLLEMTKLGLKTFRRTIGARARLTRQVLRGLNLDHAVYAGHTSQVITCVYLPPMMSVARLAKRLKEQGIVIYNGKGPLKDRLFQLGHIGALRHEDTLFALEQLTRIIKDSRGIEQHLPLGIEPLGDEVHDAA